jgi:hypothetical protein
MTNRHCLQQPVCAKQPTPPVRGSTGNVTITSFPDKAFWNTPFAAPLQQLGWLLTQHVLILTHCCCPSSRLCALAVRLVHIYKTLLPRHCGRYGRAELTCVTGGSTSMYVVACRLCR